MSKQRALSAKIERGDHFEVVSVSDSGTAVCVSPRMAMLISIMSRRLGDAVSSAECMLWMNDMLRAADVLQATISESLLSLPKKLPELGSQDIPFVLHAASTQVLMIALSARCSDEGPEKVSEQAQSAMEIAEEMIKAEADDEERSRREKDLGRMFGTVLRGNTKSLDGPTIQLLMKDRGPLN